MIPIASPNGDSRAGQPSEPRCRLPLCSAGNVMAFFHRSGSRTCALAGVMTLLAANGRATDVAGDVAGHWTVDKSPFVVVADCRVAAGETLTVDPGVQIRIAPAASIAVDGS